MTVYQGLIHEVEKGRNPCQSGASCEHLQRRMAPILGLFSSSN
jgi:hypothetical protein